jgi:hypothetical protein
MARMQQSVTIKLAGEGHMNRGYWHMRQVTAPVSRVRPICPGQLLVPLLIRQSGYSLLVSLLACNCPGSASKAQESQGSTPTPALCLAHHLPYILAAACQGFPHPHPTRVTAAGLYQVSRQVQHVHASCRCKRLC